MNKTQLHTELDFKAVRSSGAGGQNVGPGRNYQYGQTERSVGTG